MLKDSDMVVKILCSTQIINSCDGISVNINDYKRDMYNLKACKYKRVAMPNILVLGKSIERLYNHYLNQWTFVQGMK